METGRATAVLFLIFLTVGAPAPVGLRAMASLSATAPSIPTNLQIPYATNSSIKLMWQPPVSNGGSSITNYTVYRGNSLGSESLFKVLGPSTSYIDTALRSGTSYFYQVSASNSLGEGRRSYEVAARFGSNLVLTIGATYLDTGPLVSSTSVQSQRSSMNSVFVGVWTSYTSASTKLSMTGLPAGAQFNPPLPYVGSGSFGFSLSLVGNPVPSSSSYPITLGAQGPGGDNESIPMLLNVRSLGVLPSQGSLYLGQNETMVQSICPPPTSDIWANATITAVYQKPDGSQVKHTVTYGTSGTNLCTSSSASDRLSTDQTGTWYARATTTIETWDGSTEYITSSPNSQSNFPPSFSVSFTVTTPPPKSLAVTLNASPASVQSGGTSLLTAVATANDGSKPAVTYVWSASGGALNSTSGNPVLWTAPTVQATTAFAMSVTAAATGYAQASTSISVFVTPNQPLAATLGENSTAGTAPLTVQFSGVAAGGYPPYSFGWNFGDGSSSSLQNPSHTFLAAGNYTTTLTVTDSRQSSSSASVKITVLQRAQLVAYIFATPTNGTAPLTVTFSSRVAGGTAPYSFAWSFGDGGSSTAPLPVHTYSTPGAYNASLLVTDGAGAMATAAIQVVVKALAYTVTISESGLPSGASWGVTFGGRFYSSSNGSMNIGAFTAGYYQWTSNEVDTCGGCRFVPLPGAGTLIVPESTGLTVSFQAEYLVTFAASPAGAGAVSPFGDRWYPAGATAVVSARPSGTFVLDRWLSNQSIILAGSSVSAGTATVGATVNGPGRIVAQFVDAWRGSYVRAYFGNQTWRPKIVEIHVSSADSNPSWSSVATTVVGSLQEGGPLVVGSVGPAGTVFNFVTASVGIVGSPNPDGSYDFTVIQIAGNAAYVFAGLYSGNRISPSPIWGAPVWVGLLSMSTPVTVKLVFGDSITSYATATTLGAPTAGATETIVSLVGTQPRLYFTVQDRQGRTTGLDVRSNASVAKIPGSYLVKVGGALAVVLPVNLTSFSYAIDATRASQSRGNYTVVLDSVGTAGFSAQATVSGSIKQGSTATYGATLGSNGISNVRLYAVTLSTVDPLGLPAPSATATLTSASGSIATVSQGGTSMLAGGVYSLSMGTGSQAIHQTVNITQDGAVSVRVPLSLYSMTLLAGIAALIVGVLLVKRRQLFRLRRPRAKVSEWLK